MVHTHTKTFTLLNPWAETIPWECLIRDTDCISKTHNHSPMAGDVCAVEGCGERLNSGETCYAVVEILRNVADHPQWVCWRHVRPDEGPIRAEAL